MSASRGQGMLPTGQAVDALIVGNKPVDITVCDVANICVYVRGQDMGFSGHESAAQIDDNRALIARCKELRGKAAQLIGMCKNWEEVDKQSPMVPLVVIVAPPVDDQADVSAGLIIDNRCHDAMAGTDAICTTPCSRIPGSVVSKVIRDGALEKHLSRVGHPVGMMPVTVEMSPKTSGAGSAVTPHLPAFRTLSCGPTFRWIMDGKL